MIQDFLLAISFLTIIPVRLKEAPAPGGLGKAAGWYSWIGAIIGGISALSFYGLSIFFPPLLASSLAATIWIGLSGSLHLDGLADCCDGLLNASSRERRLEIMRDPRLGTFGGIGLILAVLLKIIGLYCLPVNAFWIALPLAASTGRWLLLPAGKQPLARPSGLGVDFSAGLQKSAFILAAIPVIALTVWGGWKAAGIVLVAHMVVWVVIRFARSRLGGITGDVLGLMVELAELVILVGFSVQ